MTKVACAVKSPCQRWKWQPLESNLGYSALIGADYLHQYIENSENIYLQQQMKHWIIWLIFGQMPIYQ